MVAAVLENPYRSHREGHGDMDGQLEERARIAIARVNAGHLVSEVRGFACPPHGGVAFSQRLRGRAYDPLCAQAAEKRMRIPFHGGAYDLALLESSEPYSLKRLV